MTKFKKFSTILVSSLLTILTGFYGFAQNVIAASFSVSPMNDEILLTPGETYYGSLQVFNPGTEIDDFSFTTSIAPFTASEKSDGNVSIDKEPKNYNKLVDWITVVDGTGTISPGEGQDVHYIINVPNDAPAGGQYATILVESTTNDPVEGTINIQQKFRMAYLIYANIAGETVHNGEIISTDVPGFVLNGNIEGTSVVANNGNIHVGATYKLQVFPLFSNEEVYTNEENPDTALVMPEATQIKTTAWDKTPDVGIFNVRYTVEFEGLTQTVEKMVIKCPIWLLFVIIFVVALVVFWLLAKSKSRKKSKR